MFIRYFYQFINLLAASVLLVCPGAVAAIYVSGRVVAKDTGGPVAGASVGLYPALPAPTVGSPAAGDAISPIAVTESLGNGSFLLKAPAVGAYRLVVKKEDFPPLDEPLNVPTSGVTGLHLTVTRPPMFRIHLLGVNGKPVRGGEATIWGLVVPAHGGLSTLKWDIRVVSNTGDVEVVAPAGLLPAAAGRVGIAVRDVQAGCGRMWVTGWPSAPITVHLQKGSALTGQILDSMGRPAVGIRITVGGMSADLSTRLLQGWTSVVSDGAGQFTIPSLFTERYTLEAAVPGDGFRFRLVTLSGVNTPIELTSNDDLSRPVRLGPLLANFRAAGQMTFLLPQEVLAPPATGTGLSIHGRVLSQATQEPVGGVVVLLSSADSTEPLDIAETGKDGSYSFNAPSPGQYLLRAQAGRYVPAARSVYLPLEGSISLDMEIVHEATLALRLSGPAGPLAAGGSTEWLVTTTHGRGRAAANGSTMTGPGGVLNLWVPAPRPLVTAAMDLPTQINITLRVEGVGCAILTMHQWPTGPVPVQLQKGATLTGKVVDAAGKAAGNARVNLVLLTQLPNSEWRPNGGIRPHVVADENGHFTIPNLPDGHYTVRINIPGVGTGSRQVAIAGADQDITIGPGEQVPVVARQ